MRIEASQSKKGCETKGLSKGKGSFDSFVKKVPFNMLTCSVRGELILQQNTHSFKKISRHSVLNHVLVVLGIYKVTNWMAFIVLSNKSEKPSATKPVF